MGRHAAPRQAGGDQRPLVQRARADGAVGERWPGNRRGQWADTARSRPTSRLMSGSGDQEGGYLFDVVDGEQGDDASFRPNQILAIALAHPILEEQRWRAVVDVVRGKLVTPVGLRSLAQGPSRLQADVLRGSSRERRSVPSGNGVGLVDRTIYRRLAARSTRMRPRRAACWTGFEAHLLRSWHRHSQRNLRRRTSLSSARLHRASLERCGGATSVPKDTACH